MQADLIQISVENTFMDRDCQRFNKCPCRAHFSCFLCRSVAAVHPGGARTSRTARELRQDPLESHEVSGGGERGEVHHQIHSASDRTLVRRKEVRAAPIEARVFGAGVPQETAAFDAFRKQTGRFSSDVPAAFFRREMFTAVTRTRSVHFQQFVLRLIHTDVGNMSSLSGCPVEFHIYFAAVVILKQFFTLV